MKMNDAAVLEPLRLKPADLSFTRGFLKGASDEMHPKGLTGSVLEARAILPRSNPYQGDFVAGNGPGSPAHAISSSPELIQPKVPIVWVPVMPLSRWGFEVLQKFEGTVLSVGEDSFVARLMDKTVSSPDEEAEIPLTEIMQGDLELVQPGSMFYWVIGKRREIHGQVSRSSMIRFQRLPSWSPADVERAKQEAETFLSFLDLERANDPA